MQKELINLNKTISDYKHIYLTILNKLKKSLSFILSIILTYYFKLKK